MNPNTIPPEIIERIRESSDIVNLISGYLSLKKSGKDFKGLCPFHSEKTPSFTVSPLRQVFHCFGCQAGGDIFKFLMLKEGLEFREAARELAKMAGIPVSEAEEKNTGEDATLIQINESAKIYFHQFLLHDAAAEPAREYLKKRGISHQSIEKFFMGYSSSGWDPCLKFLEKKGFSLTQIEKAGLIVRRTSGEGYHDRFRGRLMFPILNARGNCVAFGGRVLDQSQPKYLNSPESPIYQKGRILYALDKLKEEAKKPDSIVIVEGYFDAIRPYQEGIRNVVATCGTALTTAHLQSIRRIVPSVYLIFDPDEAGLRAAFRTIDLFLESGLKAFVVVLREGLDPDQFVGLKGKEEFERSIEKAVPLFDFVLQQIIQKNSPLEIEGKLSVMREILPLIDRIQNRVEKSFYLTRVANDLFISEKDLLEEYQKIQRRLKSPTGSNEKQNVALKSSPAAVPQEEEYVVRFLLAEKASPEVIFQYVESTDFSDQRAARFAKVLKEYSGGEERLGYQKIVDLFMEDSALYVWLTSLLVKEPEYDFPIQALEESLGKLRLKRKRRLQFEIEKRIPQAEQQKDHEKVSEFLKEIIKIKSEFNERVKL
ncbi:MAG: DNA primase [Nitrospirae bacterium]|nr:DNA primase [Nitrospirota bacterium]MBI3593875.1 DNA primase [Nitrospirota bacterium]